MKILGFTTFFFFTISCSSRTPELSFVACDRAADYDGNRVVLVVGKLSCSSFAVGCGHHILQTDLSPK